MLVQFKFNNFKCFKDEVTLNLVASNYFKDEPTNIYPAENYSIVNSLAIYGANASGKTKLFQAFNFMRGIVLHSADNKNNRLWQKDYDPFRLNVDTLEGTSSFEVVFLMDSIQYRYGFELDKDSVIAEWLFRKKTKEVKVVYRDAEGVEYNKIYINRKIADNLKDAGMIRNDALFISILSVWNDSLSSSITQWFGNSNVLSASMNNYLGYSLRQLDSPMKRQMLSMLNGADLGIEDMSPNEVDFESIPDEIKKMMFEEADVKVSKERQDEIYQACSVDEIAYVTVHGGEVYPNVEKTLKALSETYRLGIVSNCQCGYIEAFLQYTGFEKYISDIESYGNTGRPKADNIALVVERNGLSPKDVVYLGDTMGDYESATKAGVDFIHAAYGFGKVPEGTEQIFDIEELLER